MTEDGHLQAFQELQRARGRLVLPEDVRAYTELSFGMPLHLVNVGAQRRHGVHRDQHEGLTRWLRERGETEAADAVAQLESLRTGRWYGRQGNGTTAATIDELLVELEGWALA